MRLVTTKTTNVYRVTELPKGATNLLVKVKIKAYLNGKGYTARNATVTVKRGRVNRKAFYAQITTKGA